MYVYSHFGVGLPHNAAAQQSGTQAVPAGQEQPGDLVFFGNPAYHVGIYVGGGSMVNAPHTGAMVSYGSVAGASGSAGPDLTAAGFAGHRRHPAFRHSSLAAAPPTPSLSRKGKHLRPPAD